MSNRIYTEEAYSNYRVNKNKNIFEEKIDSNILQNIPGVTNQIINAINTLDSNKRRYATLSILDTNRSKFKKIKELLTDNPIHSVYFELFSIMKNYTKYNKEVVRVHGYSILPKDKANKMLDDLPKEIWSDPNKKWLNPTSSFSSINVNIIDRLMKGLEYWESNPEIRYRHIVENMLHVCEKDINNLFLFLCSFDLRQEYDLNIYYGSFLSEDFNEHQNEIWGKDNFDIIIGIPPFTKKDGGANASSKPVYNKYIEKSIELSDIVLMLTPSRWFGGGKGLSSFRESMKNSNHIETINHYENSRDFFERKIDIKGGVSYFIFNRKYKGVCNFNGDNVDLSKYDIILPTTDSFKLVDRMSAHRSLSNLCDGRYYFRITINDKRLKDEPCFINDKKCYVSKHKGFIKYIDDTNLIKSTDYRLATPRSFPRGKTQIKNKFTIKPGEYLNDSYISFRVKDDFESENLKSYLDTDFCRYLIYIRKYSQDITPSIFKWIPIVPFDRIWDNEKVAKYFNLSERDQELIKTYN